MLGLVQLAHNLKKYPRYNRKEDTAQMQTYLALEGAESGARGTLLSRGKGSGRADEGEGGELEHG